MSTTTNPLASIAELATTNWADMVEESTVEHQKVDDMKGFSTPKGKKMGKLFAPKKMPKNVVVVGNPSSDEEVAKKLTFEEKKANLGNNPFAAFADDSEEE